MATTTLEKRLSIVEAELAKIKRRLDDNAVLPLSANLEKSDNDDVPQKQQSIGEKFAAIRAKNPEAWNDLPADLAEQHDHYIAEAALSTSKIEGALDAALEAILRDTPDSAWEKLPADLCNNLDHYLYGTPKR